MCNDKNLKSVLRIKTVVFAGTILLILAAASAASDSNDSSQKAAIAADSPVAPANVAVTENATATAVPAVQQSDSAANKKIQSITFKKDMRIRDALAFLSLKYDKNIVPSARVDGTLAFTGLFDVSFDEAMKAILGDVFKYEQDGNLIKVYTAEEYKTIREDKGRMVSKVFVLYYVSAAEVVKLIAPMLSGVGSVQGSTPSEKILPTGQSITSGSGGGDSMALNDMVVVRDYPEKIAEAEALIKQLDVRPLQVLIEATILSAKLNENTQFGIDWSTLSGVTISSLSGVAGGTQGATATGFASSGDGLTVGVSKDKIAAIITALDSITDITIMANPKILAINKQLGQVYIGTKLGYREGSTATSSGVVQGEVKFLDTGTKLSFRPYIGNDGYIRMDIQPKDSAGELVGDPLNPIPQETSTELATNIMVKSGETVVIGGLFRDKTSNTRTQVPLLGDIPVLGALFRGTNDLTERQEVIVLLTPHIVNEPAQTNGAAAKEDVSRRRIGAKNELQWVDHRRLAEDSYAKAARYYMDGDNESAMKELNATLTYRPGYLEAIQLKERIIGEMAPAEYKKMERKVLQTVGQQ